ncbi:MAG: esterase-like activity of phytase family protein [Pseudomonadota bacterium]
MMLIKLFLMVKHCILNILRQRGCPLFTHKIAAILSWFGLFISSGETADYNQKNIEVTCKPHDYLNIRENRMDILGVIKLDSDDEDFGGLSAALISSDQKRFYALTDRARLITFSPVMKDHVLTCVKGATIRPLRGKSTRPLIGHYGDSEGMSFFAQDEDKILVSFERAPRVVEYRVNEKELRPHIHFAKFEKKELPYNKSYETVRMISDTQIMAFTEDYPEDGEAITGYVLNVEKDIFQTISLKKSNDHLLTDIGILNNGDFITLERTFSFLMGVSIQMRHIKREDMLSGKKPADGDIVFQMTTSEGADNMEAIAITPHQDGNFIYIVSDDNFTSLQNTIIVSLFYPLKRPVQDDAS